MTWLSDFLKDLAVGILGVLFVSLVIWLISSFVILQIIAQAVGISIGILVFLWAMGGFIREFIIR